MTLIYTNLPSLRIDDPWRIAVHEAGHAIAGVRFEMTFDRVEVDGREHGEVHWTHDPFDPDHLQSLDEIRVWQTIYAAGAAAEQVYFGEIRRHAIRLDQVCHTKMDMRRKEGVVDIFENAIERASGLVNVSQLKAVANQLVADKTLTFDRVAWLIDYTPSYARPGAKPNPT